jgi:anti-sigma B factor antagonist
VADHLTIDVRDAGGACVLVLAGELDLASSPDLTERAETLLADGNTLVLDLTKLSFIDSTGLGAIAGIDRSAKKAGTTLSLVAGPASVQRVFDVSGTMDAFTWIDPPD